VIGDVTIENGGVLAPGGSIGTLTISGALTFNAGSVYALQIAAGAGNNSATAVNGGATINGGTVFVLPQLGHYNATTYTIVNTSGGVSGTFASLAFAAPFAFTGTSSLSYDANDVFLNLGDGFVLLSAPGGSQNQQNVLNGINGSIIAGQTLPLQFQNLVNLSGPGLLNALSQFSGEAGAGFLQGANQAGSSFLNLLVNAFLDGRFGGGGGFGPAMGFAAEEPPALPQAALAFASAMPVKAPPRDGVAGGPGPYRAWGSAFGGAESVNGDPIVGSHTTTSRVFGFAAGIDYLAAPMTTVGFALAGGGTNWGLAGGLGGGRSDMFQAGAYASHRWDAAYLSGALAYNFHDVTTDRTVAVAGLDRLTGTFQAHGLGARLEGGYRLATPYVGVTPYGAAQVQSIFVPGYGETATSGSNQFALTYASQTATASRTEIGAWLDNSRMLANGALLTLYGRAAWAHDFGNTPSASAIFQALPGSNFVVNGAAPAPDSALVTAGAQYRLANGWSFLAKFDGEFSDTTAIYSGTGMVKKVW
jgi:outer membrane autotransporter protein